MGGIEIERMLKMIDVSIETNRLLQNAEILRYISEHEEAVGKQLVTVGVASIPTSTGTVTISKSELALQAA